MVRPTRVLGFTDRQLGIGNGVCVGWFEVNGIVLIIRYLAVEQVVILTVCVDLMVLIIEQLLLCFDFVFLDDIRYHRLYLVDIFQMRILAKMRVFIVGVGRLRESHFRQTDVGEVEVV